MDRVDNLERYLRAQIAAERGARQTADEPRDHPFVTISRQSGTGAHSFAEAMVETFDRQDDVATFGGWRIYDRSVCEIVARDERFASSLDSMCEEEYRSKANDFFHQMLRSTLDQAMVMERAFLVVRTVAGMGKAIIVGRAGSQVTNGMAQGVSLRIIAPEDQRIQRAMDTYDETQRAARANIRRRDADRDRMMKTHFGVDIGNPGGYDLTVNAGSVSRWEAAEAVTALVRSRVSAS